MSLFDIRMPAARRGWMAPLVGVATTFMVTTFAVGAPLAALYAIEQDWTRDGIRATLALYFLLSGVLAMILFVFSGLVGVATAQNMGLLAGAVLLGTAVAGIIARRISLGVFRYVVVAVTVVGSLSLLVREGLLAI